MLVLNARPSAHRQSHLLLMALLIGIKTWSHKNSPCLPTYLTKPDSILVHLCKLQEPSFHCDQQLF